jgi:hypothetical protein
MISSGLVIRALLRPRTGALPLRRVWGHRQAAPDSTGDSLTPWHSLARIVQEWTRMNRYEQVWTGPPGAPGDRNRKDQKAAN